MYIDRFIYIYVHRWIDTYRCIHIHTYKPQAVQDSSDLTALHMAVSAGRVKEANKYSLQLL